jgi:hypothetical protein
MLLSPAPSIFHREANSAALNQKTRQEAEGKHYKGGKKEIIWCLGVAFLCS